jgi:hypothetical protein
MEYGPATARPGGAMATAQQAGASRRTLVAPGASGIAITSSLCFRLIGANGTRRPTPSFGFPFGPTRGKLFKVQEKAGDAAGDTSKRGRGRSRAFLGRGLGAAPGLWRLPGPGRAQRGLPLSGAINASELVAGFLCDCLGRASTFPVSSPFQRRMSGDIPRLRPGRRGGARRIQDIYAIEADINGKPADQRRAARV